MALIGYARVSTADQDLALQLDALNAAGCERIFQDYASGAKTERPGLDEALAFLRPGDCLIVHRLDRLGRSLPHLVQVITDLDGRGVTFRSLNEGIDASASGRLVFGIFAALAEFERQLIRSRTRDGLIAAAARGRKGGRPPVMDDAKLARAKALIAQGLSVGEAARRVKVGRTTLYKSLTAKVSD